MAINRLFLKVALLLFVIAPLSPNNPQSSSFVDIIPAFFLLLIYSFLSIKSISINKDAIILVTLFCLIFVNTYIFDLVKQNSDFSVRVFITFGLFIIYYILINNINSNIEIMPYLMNIYKKIALIASAIVIISGVTGITYSWGRFSLDIIGIHKNPNYVVGFIMGAFALNVYELFNLNMQKGKVLRVVSLICMPLAFILSGTRSSLLGAAVILFLVFFGKLITRENAFRKILILLILLILVIMLFDKIANLVPERYFNRILVSKENYTEDGRIEMWLSTLKIFFNGNFLTGFGMYSAERINNNMFGLSTHNILLEALFDWGIIGICLFLFVLFTDFRKVDKEDRGIVLIFIFALYWPTLFQNGLYALNFWFPLIMSKLMINYKVKVKTYIKLKEE